MTTQEYMRAFNQLTDQYDKLIDRAMKHRDQCVQNAYTLALAGGWHGPKPYGGFQHLFHNWVVCGKYHGRYNEYDGTKMHTAHQTLNRQWSAYHLVNRWYTRKASELRAKLD